MHPVHVRSAAGRPRARRARAAACPSVTRPVPWQAALGAMALSDQELQSFATRGWVVKSIFTPEECAALRAAGEEQLAAEAGDKGKTSAQLLEETVYWSYHGIIDTRPSAEKPEGAATAIGASVFKSIWVDHPILQRCLTQLLGSDGPPVFTDSSVRMAAPHPHRHDAAKRPGPFGNLRDPTSMSWHRGIRPSWGIKRGLAPGQIHTSWLNTATFCSDLTSSDDGGTCVLSGSHMIDDEELEHNVPRQQQVICPMGSVLFFTECLIHSAVDVLSEQTRYALFIACMPLDVSSARVGWRPPEDDDEDWTDGLRQRREARRKFGARL